MHEPDAHCHSAFECSELPMFDYLQPMGGLSRRLAAVAFLLVALLFALVVVAVVASAVRQGALDDGELVGLLVCGVIASLFAWMALRLWVNRSANGVTILPVWFIEVFGAFFLCCTIWIGFMEKGLRGAFAGSGIGVAMLLVRRSVRKRRPPATAREEAAGPRFHLILLSDDTHSYEYVIGLLQEEFGLPVEKAFALTRAIDENGRAVVFTGSRDEVDLMQYRVLIAGSDPALPTSTGPLRVLVEEAE